MAFLLACSSPAARDCGALSDSIRQIVGSDSQIILLGGESHPALQWTAQPRVTSRGQCGTAYSFDGKGTSYAWAPPLPEFSFPDSPHSAVFVIRPVKASNTTLVAKWSSSGLQEWLAHFTSSGTFAWIIGDSDPDWDGEIGIRHSRVRSGKWARYTFTYDGSGNIPGFNLYVDGRQADLTSSSRFSYPEIYGPYQRMRRTSQQVTLASRSYGGHSDFYRGAKHGGCQIKGPHLVILTPTAPVARRVIRTPSLITRITQPPTIVAAVPLP